MAPILFRGVLAGLAGVALPFAMCTVTTTPDGGDEGDGSGSGGGPPTEIVVRFRNASDLALDVEFYTVAAVGADPAAVLFAPGNQLVAGIGFAGTGRIPAGESDEITVPCANAGTIGTKGGGFLNTDTGEWVGTGTQRVLDMGRNYNCGQQITFRYRRTSAGFETAFAVE